MATVIVSKEGPPCPRCKNPTQVRNHDEIGAKQLSQPYYFRQWFYCENPDCLMRVWVLEEDKVWNREEYRLASRKLKKRWRSR